MRNLYLLIILIVSSAFGYGQGTTGFSGTGGNINVDNYQIWWRINPDSVVGATHTPGIKGVITIKFKTVVPNVTAITLDLRQSAHTIDGVTWKGSNVGATWVGSSNVFSIPVSIPVSGTRDSVTITYHGKPPALTGSAGGFNLLNTANGYSVNTLSESYEDRDWWPCKADMQDKADTIDITVNVPWKLTGTTDTFWVASNGTLIDSTINATDKSRTFKYINRYPMPTYLVCLGVARYNRYYRGTVPVGGFNVPVVYYMLAGKASYTTPLAAMDKATECVAAFSSKYGNYGFIDPAKGGKHGFYEGLTGASGMEHQTMSAIATGSISSKDVLIHELQHQWFGDKVSFSTWNDLWLAEGFAEYGPALARELVSGLGSTAYSYRSTKKGQAISETAPVWIPNSGIANSDLIWGGSGTLAYGTTVYDRGCMVVSMMRTLAGDTKFFNMMTEYQTRPSLQYRSASLDTMKKLFTDSLGTNMNAFFTDNVVGTGYPTNTVGYQYFGPGQTKLALSLASQSRTNAGSATFISQPVVVHVKGALAANDTTIVFYAWSTTNISKAGNGVTAPSGLSTLTYQLSFKPTSISYDDSAHTTSQGSMTSLALVDLMILDFSARQHTGYNDASLLLDDNSLNSAVMLERSADGINFTEIGNMTLQAGNGTPKKYLFNDMNPLKTNNYYRAKYKNADGIFIYSKIVKLGAVKSDTYTIINNPVHDLLQIITSPAAGKDLVIGIYDITSKSILNQKVSNAAAITDINLPAGLAPGVYVVRIAATGEEAQNIKFIVR